MSGQLGQRKMLIDAIFEVCETGEIFEDQNAFESIFEFMLTEYWAGELTKEEFGRYLTLIHSNLSSNIVDTIAYIKEHIAVYYDDDDVMHIEVRGIEDRSPLANDLFAKHYYLYQNGVISMEHFINVANMLGIPTTTYSEYLNKHNNNNEC